MKYRLILIFIAISHLVSAQVLNGEYRDQNKYLIIKDDSISFMTSHFCSIITSIKGTGVYTISKDYLIVKTSDFKGEKSHSITTPNDDDKVDFQINDAHLNPMMGVCIAALDSSGRVFNGSITNKDGYAHLDKLDSIDNLQISFIGYETLKIKYSPLLDYNISFLQGKITENKTVIFQLVESSDDRIELMLLGTDFDSDKLDFKKLRKRAKYKTEHNCTTNELTRTTANTLE